MSTEYKVVAYTCGERSQMAKALSSWSEDGWEHLDSWRYTGLHVEMVAFLLARRPPPKREDRAEPEHMVCALCEGTGIREIPRFQEGFYNPPKFTGIGNKPS